MSDPVRTLAEGRFLRLVKRGGWEYVERVNVRDVAVLIPVTQRNEIVLVEQYRVPVRAPMIELPAGLVGDEEENRDEDLLEAANRELEEETGFRAGSLMVLARAPSSGGMTSEVVSFIWASCLTRVGEGGGVDGEDIKVHLVPVRDAPTWLWGKEKDGFLVDPKIWAGLYLVDLELAHQAIGAA